MEDPKLSDICLQLVGEMISMEDIRKHRIRVAQLDHPKRDKLLELIDGLEEVNREFVDILLSRHSS